MIKFENKIAKNLDASYISFQLNYKYYLYIFFLKKKADLSSKS